MSETKPPAPTPAAGGCPKCGAEQIDLEEWRCGSWQNLNGVMPKTNFQQSDKCRIRAALDELEKLKDAVRRAGFGICQTSGNWTIHDVSEHGKAEEKRTLEVVNQNVELQAELATAQARLAELEAPKSIGEIAQSEVLDRLMEAGGLLRDAIDGDGTDWILRGKKFLSHFQQETSR